MPAGAGSTDVSEYLIKIGLADAVLKLPFFQAYSLQEAHNRKEEDSYLIKLKHLVSGIGLMALTASATLPAYAFYSDATGAIENALELRQVRRFSFSANGGQGSMDAVSIARGSGTGLPENQFVQEGCSFAGWNTRADGGGRELADGGDPDALGGTATAIVLYAQWEDESGSLPEPKWDRRREMDRDNSGTPDRLELHAGDTVVKDPSVRNSTDREVYGYLLVSVPVVRARLAGESSFGVYDAASLQTTSRWTLVDSRVSADPAVKSRYLYRYEAVLQPQGSSQANPYHASRKADRSTDLMTGFSLRDFAECPALSSSLDVRGVFADAGVSVQEADAAAIAALQASGDL